jgi:hypothetical protein
MTRENKGAAIIKALRDLRISQVQIARTANVKRCSVNNVIWSRDTSAKISQALKDAGVAAELVDAEVVEEDGPALGVAI